MSDCPACGSDAVVISRVSVNGAELGLPDGLIHGAKLTTCEECGEVSREIACQGAVLKAYRKAIALLARPLSGGEFAFLRRGLGASGKDYAAALHVSNVTISRVENGPQVPAVQDALIRALTLLDVESGNSLERLASRSGIAVEVDVADVNKLQASDVIGGWHAISTPAHTNVVPFRPSRRYLVDEFQFEIAPGNEPFYDDIFNAQHEVATR